MSRASSALEATAPLGVAIPRLLARFFASNSNSFIGEHSTSRSSVPGYSPWIYGCHSHRQTFTVMHLSTQDGSLSSLWSGLTRRLDLFHQTLLGHLLGRSWNNG